MCAVCTFNLIFFEPCKKHLLLHPPLLNTLLKGLLLSLPLESGVWRGTVGLRFTLAPGSQETHQLSSGSEECFSIVLFGAQTLQHLKYLLLYRLPLPRFWSAFFFYTLPIASPLVPSLTPRPLPLIHLLHQPALD